MPTLRDAAGRWAGTGGLSGGVLLLVTGLLLALGIAGAIFSSTTAGPAATLTAASLNTWLPTSVSATRSASTACLVAWTPVAGAPAGLTYDVTDGTSTVVTGAPGTSASATVPAAAVTPTVRARLGTWVSSSATAAVTVCTGWPDAPGALTLTPSDGAVAATWTAPAGNGGTVASYTATVSPAPGSGSAACTVTAPTTTCSWSSMTNGVTYTVSVTGTSEIGTGPAATATAIPYPSTVMSPANLRLWLDGADAETLYAGSTCTGAAATTTVGCWKDKSAQANHATQATSGYRPGLAAAAGRQVPSLDGTDDRFALTPSLLPTGTSSSTQFVVGALDDPAPAASGHRILLTWGGTGAGTARTHGKLSGSAGMFVDSHWDGAAHTGTWLASPSLLTTEFTATSVRAAPFGSGTWTSAASTTNTGTTAAYVGLDVDGTLPWSGRVPEVVVLGTTVTDAQRRQVEEYLSRKWSMAIAPGAPTALSAAATTASSTGATVSWTAPAYDGGTAITGYTATAVPVAGGATVTCTATAPATSCTLTGLAGGGAQYSVTVTATNTAGTGPASTAATVFSGVPSAANVKLWLAADDLDGDGAQEAASEAGLVAGAVQTWQDKSGGDLDVTAPSAGERPTYTARTLNGYAVPTFDGSTVLKGTGTNPSGITGDRSLFVVARQRTVDTTADPSTSAGSYVTDRAALGDPLFSLKACSGSWAVRHRDDTRSGVACVSGGSSPSANRVDVLAGQRSGSVTSARVSASPGSSVTLASTITQAALAVGRHSNDVEGTQDLDVAEVLLYDTYLSGSQRRAVETYLATKWGASLAPDAPTGATATPTGTSGQVSVSWTAPTDVGGSALDLFTARTTSGGFSCTAVPPATTCTLTGLTNGTTYTVYVEARNSTGTGDRSSTVTVTPVTVPGAPTGVAATAGDTTSSVSWTAPASDGGSVITGYTATAVPSEGTLPTRTCTAASSPCTLTSLTNGVTYTVSVTATNAVGTGSASTSTTVVPYPSAVMTTSALRLWLDGADTATLYAASTCTGASATTTVGCWADKSGQGNNAVQATTSRQPMLSATNLPRSAPVWDAVDDQMTLTPSLLPTGTTASTQFHVVQLTDPAPASSAYRTVLAWGAATTNQKRILAKDTGSAVIFADAHGTGTSTPGSFTVNQTTIGLSEYASSSVRTARNGIAWTAGTATTFNTATTNAFLGGWSNGSLWQGPIPEIVLFTGTLTDSQRRDVEEYLARKWSVTITPAAPTSVTATGGQNAQSTVSWTAPSWNGGAAVTSYTATASPGGQTCTTTGTSCTVAGLSNGTSYTFTVTATNSVGTGPASSASASITPVGPPGAPTGVAATAGDTTSSVSWTAPASDGGSAITTYTAAAVPSDATLPTRTCTSVSSPCTLTSLTNGITYTVSVTATNTAGTGSASTSSTVVPYPSAVMTSAAMRLWLDGADGTKLFTNSACTTAVTASGQSVGCWQDRSGQGNHLTQGTAGNRPASATGTLSRLVPSFDGTDDFMARNTTTLPTGTATTTTFVAATNTSTLATAGEQQLLWQGTSTSTGTARYLYKPGSSTQMRTDAWNTTAAADGTLTSGTPFVAVSDFTSGSSYGTRMNGRPRVSTTYAYSTSGTYYELSYNGAPWKGTVQEVVVLNTAPSTADRRSIEEYLARKWAVTITPSAPQSLSASTSGSGTADLTWSAPAWNGGSAVTGYSVTVSGGAGSCAVTGTTASCTGLNDGASYTFDVSATNTAGTGPAATTSITPGVPSAPQTFAYTLTGTTINLSWTAPASQGSGGVTQYRVSWTFTSAGGSGGGSATFGVQYAYAIAGASGRSYSILVEARNASGWGPAAGPLSVVVP